MAYLAGDTPITLASDQSGATPDANDPAVAYFIQKTGRAPTDAEKGWVNSGSSNWKEQIDANLTPNGYYNLITYGNVNGPTPAQGGVPQVQPVTPTTTQAPTNQPTAAQYGVGSAYVAPQFKGTFTAPSAAEAEATPGYQFRLAQGNNALNVAASARGAGLSGGTLKDFADYNQGAASQQYQQTYNNQFQNYLQNYNQFMGNAGLASDAYKTNLGAFSTASTVSNNQFANVLAANNQNFNQSAEASAINFGQPEQLSQDYWARLLALSGQGLTATGQGATA